MGRRMFDEGEVGWPRETGRQIEGGANLVQQYLTAGLIDEFDIDLVPVLLGAGTRLFDNVAGTEDIGVEAAERVIHLNLRITK